MQFSSGWAKKLAHTTSPKRQQAIMLALRKRAMKEWQQEFDHATFKATEAAKKARREAAALDVVILKEATNATSTS